MSKCPYLFESEEFHVFVFPKQDIEVQLKYLEQPKSFDPAATLVRYQKFFMIMGNFREVELQRATNEIDKFQTQAKRMHNFLLRFIDYVNIM